MKLRKRKAFSLLELMVVLFITSVTITGACLYLYLTAENTANAVKEQKYIEEIDSVRNDLTTVLQHYDRSGLKFSVREKEILILQGSTELDRISMENTFADSEYEFIQGFVCSAANISSSSIIQINVSYLNKEEEVFPVVYSVKSATIELN